MAYLKQSLLNIYYFFIVISFTALLRCHALGYKQITRFMWRMLYKWLDDLLKLYCGGAVWRGCGSALVVVLVIQT